jgi:flagellin-like protein
MFSVSKKGISPLIATILLIAFAVGVAGIFIMWVGPFSEQKMDETGDIADRQLKCTRSVLDIIEVRYGGITNLTVQYTHGTENLYNFSLTFIDSNSKVQNVLSTNITPQYNDTANQKFTPGMVGVWNIDTSSLTGPSLTSVYVNALCQKEFPVSRVCEAGEACMK